MKLYLKPLIEVFCLTLVEVLSPLSMWVVAGDGKFYPHSVCGEVMGQGDEGPCNGENPG